MRRFVAVDDCGVRINPMIVEGQVHGGLADGVGMALMQAITYDTQGNCLAGSFMDYLLPTSVECPSWELGETVTPCPHHPVGAKGVGESATVGSPAAVVNAVMDALRPFGVRHADMPLTPANVWSPCRAAPPQRPGDPDRRRAERGSNTSLMELCGNPGSGTAASQTGCLTLRALMRDLDAAGYLADDPLGVALFLAARMGQPILLEGEPGVGKTEAAKALAGALDTPLIRLQCYEGLTAAEALYEWNYPRQLLAIRLAEARGEQLREADLFSAEYLLARPLLAALDHPGPRPAVLLIDEVDRGDDEFEAFLFELLAESAVTIPELGTRRATFPPVVVLTSNRTRDLHDALKRRCLYHWIEYPDTDRVAEIIRRRVPAAAASLAGQVARGVARLRGLDLAKPPGVAEAISWAEALDVLGADQLDEAVAAQTAGVVLKYSEDLQVPGRPGSARWSADGD